MDTHGFRSYNEAILVHSNPFSTLFYINLRTEYFQWHKAQRQLLLELSTTKDRENWKSSFRFLLMECTDMYRACGGTADRLGPLPFGLAVANATNRILLLHWTQPGPLESFLLPPLGGLDWRVPDWLWQDFQQHTPQSQWRAVTHEEKILEFAPSYRFPLIRMKFQSHTFGAEYYNSHVRTSMSDPTFEQVYHDMWRVLFTPAPAVATLIERHMEHLGLQPGCMWRFISEPCMG
jgi:hypothetical protein